MNPKSYSNLDVFAVVVSFNGGCEILDLIKNLKRQTGHVCVVDNGSDRSTLDILRNLPLQENIDVIEIGENKGIGYALNIAVNRACQMGFRWVLTMDQDSQPEEDMVLAMLNYASLHENAKCLSPNLIAISNSGGCDNSGEILYAITSGNFVDVSIYDRAGFYDEGYFIDCVDFDFSLRARKAGFDIHRVCGARMFHEVGDEKNKIPKIFRRFYTQHSPVRRYYMFRNFMLLLKSHFPYSPTFFAKLFISHTIFIVLLILYDNKRLLNVFLIGKGVFDGIVGVRGKYTGIIK